MVQAYIKLHMSLILSFISSSEPLLQWFQKTSAMLSQSLSSLLQVLLHLGIPIFIFEHFLDPMIIIFELVNIIDLIDMAVGSEELPFSIVFWDFLFIVFPLSFLDQDRIVLLDNDVFTWLWIHLSFDPLFWKIYFK